MKASIFAMLLFLAPCIFAANIIETAEQAGKFSTLLKVLKKSNLDTLLKQDGPFTVFAPTDKAFAKIPQKTLQQILDNQNTLVIHSSISFLS